MKKFIALLFFMLVISSVAFSATTKDDKKVQGTAPTGKDADLMTEEEKQEIRPSVAAFCSAFGMNTDQIMASDFTVVLPDTKNPFKQMYVTN